MKEKEFGKLVVEVCVKLIHTGRVPWVGNQTHPCAWLLGSILKRLEKEENSIASLNILYRLWLGVGNAGATKLLSEWCKSQNFFSTFFLEAVSQKLPFQLSQI